MENNIKHYQDKVKGCIVTLIILTCIISATLSICTGYNHITFNIRAVNNIEAYFILVCFWVGFIEIVSDVIGILMYYCIKMFERIKKAWK